MDFLESETRKTGLLKGYHQRPRAEKRDVLGYAKVCPAAPGQKSTHRTRITCA
jgi:hypothetical protein